LFEYLHKHINNISNHFENERDKFSEEWNNKMAKNIVPFLEYDIGNVNKLDLENFKNYFRKNFNDFSDS